MKVYRNDLIELLFRKRHNGLVKIITGIRRCGKSYLLSTLFKERLLSDGVDAKHIIEVPLDQDDFKPFRDAVRLGDYVRSQIVHDGQWNYVFIDEVQLTRKILPPDVDLSRIAPEDRDMAYLTFYDTLNGLRQLDHVDVYVTGSNSKTLSSDIESNFADRGVQIRIHPFSFAEYCDALKPIDLSTAFDHYLLWGGMPLAVAEPDDRERTKYLQRLFTEVYVSDIRKRHRLKGDTPLNQIIDVVSSAVGSLTNPHKLVNTLKSKLGIKTSDMTVANDIEHLKDAFLFSEAKRWDVKGKAYFDYPMKYYCEDVGLLNARLNFREADPSHAMENVIYNELIARNCSVDVGVVPVVSIDSNGKQVLKYHEIDFVVNRAPGKLYIQSAYELPTDEKREQELLPLRRSGDFFRKMIIVNGTSVPRISEDGIITVGAIPFLLDKTILNMALAGE